MAEPEQLTLFDDDAAYWVKASTDTQDLGMSSAGLSYESARAQMRVMAYVLTRDGCEFTGHISEDGRMHGLRQGERVTIEIVTEQTFQEQL